LVQIKCAVVATIVGVPIVLDIRPEEIAPRVQRRTNPQRLMPLPATLLGNLLKMHVMSAEQVSI
jgi:hypothetical protein